MKIALIVALLIASTLTEVLSQGADCTKDEAIRAENTVQRIDKWNDLYLSFKRVGHCDDGAIAEGYSDAIVHLLSSHWDQLRDLSKLASSDRGFFAFVIRHINATADKRELQDIIFNSKRRCPKSDKALCSAIRKAARIALAEMQTEGQRRPSRKAISK